MEENLKFFLSKLGTLPECRNDDFYRWADYIELKCLANKDGIYSKNDFVDDIRPLAEDLGEGDFEDNQKTAKLANAEKNDKWETIANDTFRVLQSRVVLFGDLYPFCLSENHKTIHLKENLDEEKRYIFLLLCSDLRYTTKFNSRLTSSFELLSLEAMKKIFPNSDLYLFGSSNIEGQSNPWKSSKLWDKLVWLEEFLHEKLTISESDVSHYDKGDRGVDIVGKIQLDDEMSHAPILLAQCACSTKDWVTKQHSITYASWSPLISLSTDPNCFVFIPQSYRDSKGEWHDRTKIHRTCLMDRHRILRNFQDQDKFKGYSSFPIIEEILTYKDSTF